MLAVIQVGKLDYGTGVLYAALQTFHLLTVAHET
jgi:hypothetical protein